MQHHSQSWGFAYEDVAVLIRVELLGRGRPWLVTACQHSDEVRDRDLRTAVVHFNVLSVSNYDIFRLVIQFHNTNTMERQIDINAQVDLLRAAVEDLAREAVACVAWHLVREH